MERTVLVACLGVATGAAAVLSLQALLRSLACVAARRPPLPPAATALSEDPDVHEVTLREWEDQSWRRSKGWKGRDLCHNPAGRGVVVQKYFFHSKTRILVGFVHFGEECESHRGLCHGGAMCALLDDFCGHCAFIDSDAPWNGATVQVNCKLKKPVPVGAVLMIVGKVARRQGNKVFVVATLEDDGGAVYAVLDGLSIGGVKIGDADDDVSERTWVHHTVCGSLVKRDSSYVACDSPDYGDS